MAALAMSQSGLDALAKEEGSIDGLYDDVSGYATFGVGHLVHHVERWGAFLLAAALTRDAWKGKLQKGLGVTYLPRSAAQWSDWPSLQAKAVELGQQTVAKKRFGKAADKLSASEKDTTRKAAEAAVREEVRLLATVPTQILRSDLVKYELGVNGTISGVLLGQDEFDALVSLTFNIGTTAFRASLVARKINEGRYRLGDATTREAAIRDVEAGFLAWNKSGGIVRAALTARRRREASRFLERARQELEAMKLRTSMMIASATMRGPCAPR